MVAEFASSIVNRASQGSYIEGATGNDGDSDSGTHTTPSEGSATLWIYKENDNTIGMLGKMSAKLPMPTQID
eukprot:4882918-Amphidinium_carterae.1